MRMHDHPEDFYFVTLMCKSPLGKAKDVHADLRIGCAGDLTSIGISGKLYYIETNYIGMSENILRKNDRLWLTEMRRRCSSGDKIVGKAFAEARTIFMYLATIRLADRTKIFCV